MKIRSADLFYFAMALALVTVSFAYASFLVDFFTPELLKRAPGASYPFLALIFLPSVVLLGGLIPLMRDWRMSRRWW